MRSYIFKASIFFCFMFKLIFHKRMCVKERERDEGGGERKWVSEREREGETESVCMWVCMCVCVGDRGTKNVLTNLVVYEAYFWKRDWTDKTKQSWCVFLTVQQNSIQNMLNFNGVFGNARTPKCVCVGECVCVCVCVGGERNTHSYFMHIFSLQNSTAFCLYSL